MSTQNFQEINREFAPDRVEEKSNIQCSKAVESIKLLGVRVDLLTENRLNQYISNVIERKSKKLVLNVNIHCYNMIFKNPWMRNFFDKAEVIFCDGSGVALGAKILGLRMPKRFTPADSIWSLAKLAEKKGHSFYFLGAEDGIAEKAAQKMKARYPNLKITTHHGYFDKSPNSVENQKVVAEINTSKANILVVGFGMPFQEKWLEDNWDDLNVNIGFSAGALFDYVSGELRRGPRWMTNNGLEWLARMLIEPKRLWRRYFIGNTVFLYKVITERLEDIMREAIAMWRKIFFLFFPSSIPITNRGNHSHPLPQNNRDLLGGCECLPNRETEIITSPYTATRKYLRRDLPGYTAKVINDDVAYSASVENASLEGIQLQQLSKKFQTNKADQFNIIICDFWNTVCYKLTVQQKWLKKNGSYIAAGFNIVNPPTEWKNFMLHTT